MATSKITETAVKKLSQGGEIRDTEIRGFFVRARKESKVFYYSYLSPTTGKRRNKVIGKHGNLTVSAARDAAQLMSADVARGTDPADAQKKAQAKAAKEKASTLKHFLENEFRRVTPAKTADEAVSRIEKHFPDWLEKPMHKITSWDVDLWKRKYKGAPAGANRILSSLRGVLSKAVKAGLLDKTPMPDVKQLKVDKNKKIRYLSSDEEKRLRQALDDRQDKHRAERNNHILWCSERGEEPPPPYTGRFTDHIKPIVILTLNTGLRLGEVFNLRVSDIDLPSRLLTVTGEADGQITGSKSGHSRMIPLNDEAFSTVAAWLNQTGSTGLVFPSPVTGGRFHNDGIKTAWTAIRKAAGLTKFRFHDLRHTFGTRLAHARVDLVTIKDLMGHESLDTTSRYLHTSDQRKIEAVSVL